MHWAWTKVKVSYTLGWINLCGRFERYRVGSQRHDVVGRFLRAPLSSFSVFVALSFRRLLVFTAGIQKKKKKEPWCCPDLWVILMAVRDIGCLFPRSPEGGRQGGVRAAGSFICDGKSPCHIDGWLGVASAATRALYQTTVPQRRAEPGGRGFSIYESINIQTLTYGHEIWVVTVRIRLLKRDFSWESQLDSVWGEMAGSSDIQGKKKKSKSNRRPTPARRLGWVSD